MHTNSTTNYNLPQFLPTDKPAWLTDVNPAYLAIDAGMKANADAAAAAQTDATQALADAAGAAATATQANSKADGAVASLAENFLDTATYATGEYVVFNNILYVCTEPVTTPGPWTGSVNWSRASVDSIASGLQASVSTLSAKTGSDIPISTGSSTSINDAVNNVSSGTITLNSTNVTSGDVHYTRIGKIVIVSGYFLPANGDNQAVVFNLPYAPVHNVNIAAQTDQSPYCIYMAVNANETDVRTGLHTINSYIRFEMIYIAA